MIAENAGWKVCDITHKLLVKGRDEVRWLSQHVQCHSLPISHRRIWMRLLLQNVQCHSLAVDHRERCNEPSFHKMSNITHFLLVIGKDMIRLPFTKSAMWHTSCLPQKEVWFRECLSQKCHNSHAVVDRKRCDESRLSCTKCTMSPTSCWW